MKVTQEVSTKFCSLYAGWGGLNFTDSNGNKIVIDCTDDQFLEIERLIIRKCDGIREERREKVEEEASE